MNCVDTLRQTGRTTRLLAHAKRLAREGRAVYVVVDSEREKDRLEWVCGAERSLGISFETLGSLPNFDLHTMTLRGSHANCVVLVDHHVIESRCGRMLAMLHAYDE